MRTNLWFECGPQEMQSWVWNLSQHGGFDPLARTLTPLRRLAQLDRVQFVLDSIAAASETGLYAKVDFLPVCFATHADYREFLGQLRTFEDYWVNERHFYAFLALVGEESGCTTYGRIARSLDRKWSAAASGEIQPWPSEVAT
jgi:hypothetical protein